MEHHTIDWKKYIFTFLITAIIFGTAIYLSSYFSNKKVAEIRGIQDKIAVDILSSETQFSLLAESSCKDIDNTSLSKELSSLEGKLTIAEKDRGTDNSEVQYLKQYYALLEIKDYLLMKKVAQKCNAEPLYILYFYSTPDKCPDCEKEGYVLTKLRETYPKLRIYSFDYDTNLSALQTLIEVHKIKSTLPALLINETPQYEFKSIEDIEKLYPQLVKSLATTTTIKVK